MAYRLIVFLLFVSCSHIDTSHLIKGGVGALPEDIDYSIYSAYSYNKKESFGLFHNLLYGPELMVHHSTDGNTDKDSFSLNYRLMLNKDIVFYDRYRVSVSGGAGIGYLEDDLFLVKSGSLGSLDLKTKFEMEYEEYRIRLIFWFKHISNPFYHASEGDTGHNALNCSLDIEFSSIWDQLKKLYRLFFKPKNPQLQGSE
jgi:hypothetical protein